MDASSSIKTDSANSLGIKQKKELNDSIRYASYIQKALLPSQNEIDWCFTNNFLLYLPRDVVSGDFYWFYRFKDKVLFAVADCTGHGVPGAFMSVLGISLLNQIVLSHKEITAGGILDLLREHIMKSLHQTGSAGEQKDGMDIALGILDFTSNQLQYAGANNPLYLVRNNHLLNYEPDRMPIGIHPVEEVPFNYQNIQLEKDDMIYMFTDGYPDQFGGKEGKKLKYRAFRELLTSVNELSVHDQKEIIHQKFVDWKGEIEQVDDVLILGIRYSPK